METPTEDKPASVPAGATQAGAVRERWSWTEPTVWTDRMLTALENGVKGGRWFSLIDKVISPKNLSAAWERVRRNDGAAGVDRQTVESFSAQDDSSLKWLHEQLREGRYRPAPVRRVLIPKPGTNKQRPLGIPTVRDRIVQGALRNVLEPIFEHRFSERSYGFRPGRGCKDALRRVSDLLARGFVWVVDADIQSYFDAIPKRELMEEASKEIADGRVLQLIEAFLAQSVMEGAKEWQPETGTPQGAVISPLLANIYLHPVDLALEGAGFEIVRYADDLVILCRNEAEARGALTLLDELMRARKLSLHPEKTRIVDARAEGFDFLGYHFDRGRKLPRKKSLGQLRDRVRELTPRLNGRSLAEIIRRLNAVLTGWFEYFKHCMRSVFREVDGFVRRRLRAMLLRRHRKHARIGAGNANIRWPNAFFVQRGLISLAAARASASRSRR